MSYLGQQPGLGNYKKLDDISSSFNGIITEFEVTIDAVSENIQNARQCILSLNGVLQEAEVAFDIGISPSSIAFSEAPQAGDTFWCIIVGDALDISGVSDNTISSAKIVNGAVINAKLGADAVDGTKVADLAIDTEHLVASAVTNAKIVDNAVTLQKIQDNAVTIAKIASSVIASQAEAEAGTATDVLMTPEQTSQAIDALSYKQLIDTQVISSVANVEFKDLPDKWILEAEYTVTTDGSYLHATTSPDTGASPVYDVTSLDYHTAGIRAVAGSSTVTAVTSTTSTYFVCSGHTGSAAGEFGEIEIVCKSGGDATKNTLFMGQQINNSISTGELYRANVSGQRLSADVVRAIKIFESGAANISGTFRLYKLN